MTNELTKKEQDMISAIKDNDISKVIKPLMKEIHLFDSYVADTAHLQDATVLDTIKEGDWLFLKREDNKFDSNAIAIFTENKKKLGYVPEKDNVVFAKLMDAGKLLKARISSITSKGSFRMISVGIYLVDF